MMTRFASTPFTAIILLSPVHVVVLSLLLFLVALEGAVDGSSSSFSSASFVVLPSQPLLLVGGAARTGRIHRSSRTLVRSCFCRDEALHRRRIRQQFSSKTLCSTTALTGHLHRGPIDSKNNRPRLTKSSSSAQQHPSFSTERVADLRQQEDAAAPLPSPSQEQNVNFINYNNSEDETEDPSNHNTRLQEAFERDVAHVLRELRPWKHDPTVPGRWNRRQLSFTNYWGLEEWQLHSSRWRHWRHLWQWHQSRLLRGMWPQLLFLFLWSLGANHCWARLVSEHTLTTAVVTSAWQQIPLTALSLISTFVAALLTLRSNQGLARLSDARLALGQMVLHTRDTALLWSTYIFPHDPVLSWRAARHLALWGWVLKSHFREIATNGDDIVEALLYPHPDDVAYCQWQRKRPVAVLLRLRQMIHYAAVERQYIGTTEHRLLEDNLKQLNQVVMQGERIRASPVPPVYSAHASRLMTVYLLLLPWALRGAHLGGTAAVAVTMVVGFAMLGLDEMSHMFEQPFKYMPLYHLAKVSMLDVADAFCLRPPALDWNHNEKDHGNRTDKNSSWRFRRPVYWHVRGRDPRLPYDGSDVPVISETLKVGG